MSLSGLTTKTNNFKYGVALTGGIATGKSTVSNLFMLYGFLTIDADDIAHKLLDENISTIEKLFGKKYIKNNKVSRKELGKLIFANKKEKKKLEEFLHPLIKKDIISKASLFESKKKPYLIDIPLFFETKSYDIKKSIVVYTTKQIQIQRLIKRDNCTKDEAILRIDNQMDIEKKKTLATFVIDNCKDLKNLQDEVQRVVKELL
jgi:dephospho-CoA kinase